MSIPSRGFCFLGKHVLKRASVTGSAFLAGAFCFLGKDDLRKGVRQIGHLARTVAPRNFQPQGFPPDRPDSRQIGPARLAPSWRQIGRSSRTGKSARLTPPDRRQIDNSLPAKGIAICSDPALTQVGLPRLPVTKPLSAQVGFPSLLVTKLLSVQVLLFTVDPVP